MTRTPLLVAAAAGVLTVLMIGTATTGMAQTPMPSHDKMPQHQEGKKDMKDMKGMHDMKDMQGMQAMMAGPHHALAMAYRDNLVTFARALQGQVTHSKSVDLELARPAVAEMTRSFGQLKQHHAAGMAKMGEQMPQMSRMMQQMETRVASLSAHLTALESEVNGSTPNSRIVSEHTAAILKDCAGMSGMSGKAMSHPKK